MQFQLAKIKRVVYVSTRDYHNLSLYGFFQQNVAKHFIGMVESKKQALTQALKEIKLWLCGFVLDWSLDATDVFFGSVPQLLWDFG